MRVVRWILIITAALVLLAGAALVSLTLLINPDQYRGEIQRVVSRATGRPFVIEGHLRISWFPWLGLRMGPARLGAAPGEPGPDLIEWRSARLSVRLLPLLLHRQVVIGPVRLRGADIHLWRAADGRGNWQDLLDRASSRSGGGTAAPALPVVGGLELVDGALHYVDRKGTRLDLTHWQLRVSVWQPDTPLTVSTRFLLQGGPLPATGVPVELHVRRLRIEATPLAVSAPAVSLKVADVTAKGMATLSRGADGLDAAGSMALAVPSVRGLIGLLGIRARLPKDPTALGTLALSGRWSLKNSALEVNPLTGRLDATRLAGWVDRLDAAQPSWTFALGADRIDLGRYLPPTRKPPKPFALPVQALRALHARGTLTVGQASFEGTTMQDIRLQVQ